MGRRRLIGRGAFFNPNRLISNITYYSDSIQLDSNTFGFDFNTDGSKIFSVSFNGLIKQYSLSTNYDISTMSYDSLSYQLTTVENVRDISMCNTNYRLLVLGRDSVTNEFLIKELNLSTENDITTTTESSNVFATGGELRSLEINNNGKDIVLSSSNYTLGDQVVQLKLSTPNDITTASFFYISPEIGFIDQFPFSTCFFNNGWSIVIGGSENKELIQLNMTERYKVGGISVSTVLDSVLDISSFGSGDIYSLKEKNNYIYNIKTASRRIYQFSII